MNIGIDARFILRPMRGMPLYVMRLCQWLPRVTDKHNFFYFINESFEHNAPKQEYVARMSELAKLPNVKIINHNDDAEILWEQIYLPRMLKRHKIDILHMPANRISFTTRIPIVVTLHDIIDRPSLSFRDIKSSCSLLKPRQTQFFLRQNMYKRLQYEFGFKRAHKIITVSNYSASDIVNGLNISGEKIVVIYHGSDIDFLNKPPIPFSKRQHMLVLGGNVYHKNLEGAINSWLLVPENIKERFPLKIVGFLKNARPQILALLSDDKVKKYVTVSGWISDAELINNFQTAAAFMLLSYSEGFGFPLLHAMEAGTPIVASNVASIPEVLGNVGLKCAPDDHIQISRNITALLTNNELWEEQVSLGQERVSTFSWHSSALKHLDVYEDVFGQKGIGNK